MGWDASAPQTPSKNALFAEAARTWPSGEASEACGEVVTFFASRTTCPGVRGAADASHPLDANGFVTD